MKYVDASLADRYRFIVFDKFDHHLGGVEFQCVKKTYAGDFSDKALLEQIFRENKIDIVLHSLSTTVPIDSSNARFDVESNLLPTLDILNLMVKYHVQDIVYLSSGGAIYGVNNRQSAISNLQSTGFREDADVFPVSSYGVVKLAIEKYIMQYAQLYGLRPLILRLSNPYGPYHYSMKQGVINIAITKALQGERFEIWGDGNGKKDYFYVEDYAAILFRLLELGEKAMGKVINVASGQLLSVNEITTAIQDRIPSFQISHSDAQKLDASHFELDANRLHSLLPDFQFTSLDDGLEKTFAWTKQICSN